MLINFRIAMLLCYRGFSLSGTTPSIEHIHTVYRCTTPSIQHICTVYRYTTPSIQHICTVYRCTTSSIQHICTVYTCITPYKQCTTPYKQCTTPYKQYICTVYRCTAPAALRGNCLPVSPHSPHRVERDAPLHCQPMWCAYLEWSLDFTLPHSEL